MLGGESKSQVDTKIRAFSPTFQNACPPLAFIQSSWLSCEADGSGDTPKLQAGHREPGNRVTLLGPQGWKWRPWPGLMAQ